MNKRIYFILVPVLAILFSIIYKVDNPILFKKADQGLCIANTTVRNHFHFSPNVKKQSNTRIKNAIRIKACHDATAIDVTPASVPVITNSYFTQVVMYGGYNPYELSAHFPVSCLRGPPSA